MSPEQQAIERAAELAAGIVALQEVVDDDEFYGDVPATALGCWEFVVGWLLASAERQTEEARRATFDHPDSYMHVQRFSRPRQLCDWLRTWQTGQTGDLMTNKEAS